MRARLAELSPYMAYLGLASLVAGGFIYLIDRRFDVKVEGLLAAGFLLLGIYVLLNPSQVRAALTGRTARYGGNATLMFLAFVGILFLLNFIASRHHRRFDLTELKRFSLSPQTIQVLKELKEPVHITAFLTAADPRRQELDDLLKEYTYHTDKVSYEFVDPDRQPAIARQFGITSYGMVVFVRGDKRQDVYVMDEQDVTSAILKVASDEVKGVYFLTGHKERDIQNYDLQGYTRIKELLEKDNYKVDVLNLAVTTTIPSDAAVIVVAGPQVSLAQGELETLSAYLEEGGKALLMLDPGQENPFGDLLDKYGVRFRDDLVIDPPNSFFGDVASPLVVRYPYSQITKDLGGLATFFPHARSIEETQSKPEGVKVTPLIRTSDGSWGETSLEDLRHVAYDEGQDTLGPLTLAVSVEATASSDEEAKTRLVIFGDTDFVSNSVLHSVRGAFGNADLFLNAINWLAEEEALISIRPKPPEVRRVILNSRQMRLILYSSVGFLPLSVLLMGAAIWWRRR